MHVQKMISVFGVFATLAAASVFSQLVDDFDDGTFVSSPQWSGTSEDYRVNTALQLQLDNSVAGTSYLTVPHGLSDLNNKEWKLWTRQSFSPSNSNFGRIYLTADSASLSEDPDGFYIQLGESGSNDAVRLCKSVAGVHTELIVGTPAQIASSFSIGIRITRDESGNWELYVDPSGGINYELQGTATEPQDLIGTHFGFLSTYTSSNATKFYYDDIYVGDQIQDTLGPTLLSASASNSNAIDVLFDEHLDSGSAEMIANYTISPTLSVVSATIDAINPALVHLVLTQALTNGQVYDLTTANIQDVAGNTSENQQVSFGFYVPEAPLSGDVVINEFMCDPSPKVGLPEVEYVEIYNRSTKVFQVSDWKLSDGSSFGTLQEGWLLPGMNMILTSSTAVDSFPMATPVTSFPSLNNAGDAIFLYDGNGQRLDSISYTKAWYVDSGKEGGGYSIERINPDHPCSDASNWAASNAALGGTPGLVNSIFDDSPDTTPPSIRELVALSPNFLEIYYNKGMDSSSLVGAMFSFDPALTVQNNFVLQAGSKMQTLQFSESILGSKTYTIEIQNVSDCWQNVTDVAGSFALPEAPENGDVVLNELLFNPVSNGADWVEVYNTSEKLINLKDWQLANFSDDTIANVKTCSENFFLYPDTYAVFGEDTLQIVEHYTMTDANRLIQMDLPSYPNDSGTVFLMYNGQVMDRVAYRDDWHFSLLDNVDGISLERLSPQGISNDADNWHSAAESAGFGTPGMKNSQFYPALFTGEFDYSSESISPDNDGFEDLLQVNYRFTEPGFVGSFSIYDDRGRKIAKVLESELLSTQGTFVWDGVRDDETKATIGTYIGVFEAYNVESGSSFAKRKVFVVAGRL